jgi:hypothetical protein
MSEAHALRFSTTLPAASAPRRWAPRFAVITLIERSNQKPATRYPRPPREQPTRRGGGTRYSIRTTSRISGACSSTLSGRPTFTSRRIACLSTSASSLIGRATARCGARCSTTWRIAESSFGPAAYAAAPAAARKYAPHAPTHTLVVYVTTLPISIECVVVYPPPTRRLRIPDWPIGPELSIHSL